MGVGVPDIVVRDPGAVLGPAPGQPVDGPVDPPGPEVRDLVAPDCRSAAVLGSTGGGGAQGDCPEVDGGCPEEDGGGPEAGGGPPYCGAPYWGPPYWGPPY